MTQWETPKLAADWLCENTDCSIRWTDQCPVFRILEWITAPVNNNVIHLENQRWEMAGFRKSTYDGYRPENVVWMEEWRAWLELTSQVVKDSTLGVQDMIVRALKTNKKVSTILPEADIIPFPKNKTA